MSKWCLFRIVQYQYTISSIKIINCGIQQYKLIVNKLLLAYKWTTVCSRCTKVGFRWLLGTEKRWVRNEGDRNHRGTESGRLSESENGVVRSGKLTDTELPTLLLGRTNLNILPRYLGMTVPVWKSWAKLEFIPFEKMWFRV